MACLCNVTKLLPPFKYSHPWSSENTFFSNNQQNDALFFFWGQSLPFIYSSPSLDNIALIDFYSARLDVGWQNDQISGLTSPRWPQLPCYLESDDKPRMFLYLFIPEFYKKSTCTTIFLITLTDNMIMIIKQGNMWTIFAFFLAHLTFTATS